MRAQLVSENINFERGGEDHIYTKIGIGERERVLKFLDDIAGDIQFQREEPEYMGYLDVIKDWMEPGLMGPDQMEAFERFIKDWKKYLPDLEERGLYLVDPPTLEKTTFYDEPEPEYGVHAIRPVNEKLEFEKGQNPRKSMGVGKLATAEWDYRNVMHDSDIEEEYLYKGWPIRIFKRYFHNKSPYPEYAGVSEKGITNFGGRYRLKWYKRKGYAKKWIEGAIDELEFLRSIANESMDFERGRDPKASLGIGTVSQIPKKLLLADLDGEYVLEDFPGAIHNIEIIGPRRFMIRLHHPSYGKIRNTETNNIISRKKYAEHLVDKIGITPLITNVNHEHGSGNNWIFTLPEEYKNVLPRGEIYDFDSLENDPLKESLEFERGKDPYKALDIGEKALLKKKANEIGWDWYPETQEEQLREEVLDILDYKGFKIKIARIEDYDSDLYEKGEDIYAVSDTGEGYADAPTFYDNEEEALKYEKSWLDEYFIENQ